LKLKWVMASKVINPNTNHQNLLDLATASGQAQDTGTVLYFRDTV
jgi:hypothetical protein